MSEKRGASVASSFLFKLMESIGAQGISFVVGILLARLLSPYDYTVLGMLMAFIAIAQVFVQSGLNTALIQKKEVDEKDRSSVFWLSLAISAVLYLILALCAPAIGTFFHMPELVPLLRVIALMLFPGA
ncbi:MAG: oligosaccharide flippase family protein, partial [Clostridia bacterium]